MRAGGDHEIRVLNVILRVGAHGLKSEAGPRHAELLGRALDVDQPKFISTPGVKRPEDLDEPQPVDVSAFDAEVAIWLLMLFIIRNHGRHPTDA